MSAAGRTNPWPKRFGGGRRARTIEAIAIKERLRPYGFALEKPSVKDAEAKAYGNAIGSIWAINERLRGAEIPSRMMETLTIYETALRLRPALDALDNERRAAVGAKLRALTGQATIGDIEDVCRALLGQSYVQVTKPSPADNHTYLPGGGGADMAALSAADHGTFSPGPPGYEWSTSRCTLAIVTQQGTLDDTRYTRLKGLLLELLQTLVPSYVRFEIGEGTAGFIVDIGIVDVTFL